MRLIYKDSKQPVKIGDIVDLGKGEMVDVQYFREPHKAGSTGKVTVETVNTGLRREYFVGIIGAAWVEREDQS